MKKIAPLMLIWAMLVPQVSFAVTPVATSMNDTVDMWVDYAPEFEIFPPYEKDDIILRNNRLEADYEYNDTHYFTKKILSGKISIPEEVQKNAKSYYFLVEEGYPMIYYKSSLDAAASEDISYATDVYNYKTIAYTPNKDEYVFDSKSLVKDFSKDEYKNVTITLIAELNDGKKQPLSYPVYIYLQDKQGVLTNMYYQEVGYDYYYGYLDPNTLGEYLETKFKTLSRSDYKKVLEKASSNLKTLTKKNDANQKEIMKKITKESDFDSVLPEYTTYMELNELLSQVGPAINNQLQKIRSYDMLDQIFGK